MGSREPRHRPMRPLVIGLIVALVLAGGFRSALPDVARAQSTTPTITKVCAAGAPGASFTPIAQVTTGDLVTCAIAITASASVQVGSPILLTEGGPGGLTFAHVRVLGQDVLGIASGDAIGVPGLVAQGQIRIDCFNTAGGPVSPGPECDLGPGNNCFGVAPIPSEFVPVLLTANGVVNSGADTCVIYVQFTAVATTPGQINATVTMPSCTATDCNFTGAYTGGTLPVIPISGVLTVVPGTPTSAGSVQSNGSTTTAGAAPALQPAPALGRAVAATATPGDPTAVRPRGALGPPPFGDRAGATPAAGQAPRTTPQSTSAQHAGPTLTKVCAAGEPGASTTPISQVTVGDRFTCAVAITASAPLQTGSPVLLTEGGPGAVRFAHVSVAGQDVLGTATGSSIGVPGLVGQGQIRIDCFNNIGGQASPGAECDLGQTSNCGSSMGIPEELVPALLTANGFAGPPAGACVIYVQFTAVATAHGVLNESVTFPACTADDCTVTGAFAGTTLPAIPTGGVLTIAPRMINGTVTLQGRTGTTPVSGHGTATVTLSNSGGSATVNADGSFTVIAPPDGPYTITACAPGYLCAEREITVEDGAVVGGLPAVQLRAGLVTADTMVTIADLVALIAAFGSRPTDGVVNGNRVDLNGDGVVNLQDITLTLSNFGRAGPTSWP